MKKRDKEKFEDDGRTIANMNVEGMPWYNPLKSSSPIDKSENNGNGSTGVQGSAPEPLGFKETVAMTKGVLGAALLIGGIFVIIFLIFILFCVFVWF